MTTIARVGPPEAPPEAAPEPVWSILDWSTTQRDDPKILAQAARSAATLTHLVMAGIHAEEERGGVDASGLHFELARECAAFSELLSSVLARSLGAVR
jgi:hypothetical protein